MAVGCPCEINLKVERPYRKCTPVETEYEVMNTHLNDIYRYINIYG